jgi:hypothetical protein
VVRKEARGGRRGGGLGEERSLGSHDAISNPVWGWDSDAAIGSGFRGVWRRSRLAVPAQRGGWEATPSASTQHPARAEPTLKPTSAVGTLGEAPGKVVRTAQVDDCRPPGQTDQLAGPRDRRSRSKRRTQMQRADGQRSVVQVINTNQVAGRRVKEKP